MTWMFRATTTELKVFQQSIDDQVRGVRELILGLGTHLSDDSGPASRVAA